MSTTLENTDLDIFTDLTPYEDVNDGKDHRTHIVNPNRNPHIYQVGMTAQDIVNIARSNGYKVVALCGYTWVPKRNPEKYDVCEECFHIAQEYMAEDGE